MKERFKSPRRKLFVAVLLFTWAGLFAYCEIHPIKAIRINTGTEELVLQTDSSLPEAYREIAKEDSAMQQETDPREELLYPVNAPAFNHFSFHGKAKSMAMRKETILP